MEITTTQARNGVATQGGAPGLHDSLYFDLQQQLQRLRTRAARQQGAWKKGVARELLVDYPDLRVSLVYLAAGGQIEEHYNPGRIVVHTVAGHIRMRAGEETFDLPLGAVLALDRAVPHQLQAVEESAFLLTVVPPAQ